MQRFFSKNSSFLADIGKKTAIFAYYYSLFMPI